jgi:hypothetical protein
MRISNILFEQHMHNSKKILRESCDGLTYEQRQIVEGYYNELRPLIEASLSPEQIKQVFGQVEKSATDAGGNRTMIGQSKDVLAKANEIIDKAGSWLQNTTPVKAFDQKFEQLKNKINTSFPDSKILDGISNLGIYAKENPGKTAAIVGILTAIASLAGGPIGGAIAGQVLRGAVELLKGEKLSTAIGKGVKTAVFGYLSGKAFELLGDFAEGMRIKSIPFQDGLEKIDYGASKVISSPGMEWTRTIQGVNVVVDPEMASAIRSANNMLRLGGDAASEGFDQLSEVAKIITSKEYRAEMAAISQAAAEAAQNNDSLLQFLKVAKTGLSAMSQGAVAAAGVASDGKKESVITDQRPLSEGQVYLVFNRITQLNEGPMDAIKGAVGKAANWAKTKGTNLTTKITADKLNSAWQKAGAPTDSEELKKFLTTQGVDAAMIDTVYKSLKIKSGVAATSMYAQVKTDLAKLDKKGKQRLAAYLQKQLGTA